MAEALAIVALGAALLAAVTRLGRFAEAGVALAGAALLLALGTLGWHGARDEAGDLAPTLVTLAALLVLGEGCARAGLFDALAARLAAGARGRPPRLLALVFAAATAVTVVLGLDATVVLLTPAVLAAAARARLRARPHVYACAHLANSASLLLPVSNLTNLLAFRASGLSFARFAALMALPWALALAIEWLVLRASFAADLRVGDAEASRSDANAGTGPSRRDAGAGPRPRDAAAEPSRHDADDARTALPPLPRAPLLVLALTLAGFAAASPLGLDAAWPAALGALALTLAERTPPRALARALDLPLLCFVLGLGLIVRAVAAHGLGGGVAGLVPSGNGLLALLATAALAAALANLLNNLPAVLVLLPAAAAVGPATVLALLIGVNVGPNLTYTGSLATLLWRRILRQHDSEPSLARFTALGLLSVPPILAAATAALWLVA